MIVAIASRDMKVTVASAFEIFTVLSLGGLGFLWFHRNPM